MRSALLYPLCSICHAMALRMSPSIPARTQVLVGPGDLIYLNVLSDAVESDGERETVTAVALTSTFRPCGRCNKLLSPHRSTPPDAFARDHDRQQVSWLAGYRLGPPSQKPESFQWYLWSSAIRLQLRGQPRICTPICAYRIPLVSPCRHDRLQTWHRTVLRVNRRIDFHAGLPSLLNFKLR